jgi:hypothetical protein
MSDKPDWKLSPEQLAARLDLADESVVINANREKTVRALSFNSGAERSAFRAVATGEIPAAFTGGLDPGYTSCSAHGIVRTVNARTGDLSTEGTLCEHCAKQTFSPEARAARTAERADYIRDERKKLEAEVARLAQEEREARGEVDREIESQVDSLLDDLTPAKHEPEVMPDAVDVPEQSTAADGRDAVAGAAHPSQHAEVVEGDALDAWLERL